MAKMTTPKPKRKPKAEPWTIAWSGSGGSSLGVTVTNPGDRPRVLPVFAGPLEIEAEDGFEPVAGSSAAYLNRVNELAPGPNGRRCLRVAPSGAVVETCYTGAPDLRLPVEGTYRLSFAVGSTNLPALAFVYRNGKLEPAP